MRIPIDVLPNRSYEVISEWLREYLGIKFISMNRSATYSSTAKKELSQAKVMKVDFILSII
jgi:transposase